MPDGIIQSRRSNGQKIELKWASNGQWTALRQAPGHRQLHAQKRHSPDIVANMSGHVALTEVGPAATTLNCRSSSPRFIGWFQSEAVAQGAWPPAAARLKRPVASCATEVSNATHTGHWLEMPLTGRFELRRMSAPDPLLPFELSEVQRQVAKVKRSFEATAHWQVVGAKAVAGALSWAIPLWIT